MQSDGFVVDSCAPSPPTIVATVNGSSYSGSWTSGDIKLVASGSSALSGIQYYEYKIGDGTWTKMPAQSGAVDSTSGNAVPDSRTITSDMNDNIHIRAVSNSDVTGNESVITVKLDSVTPALKVNVSGTTEQWTSSPVTFTLSDTATNLSQVTYYEKVGAGDWTQLPGYIVSLTTETNTTYPFKAESAAGVWSAASAIYTVKLDIVPPRISDVTGNPVNWTNGDVTLTVGADDNGGSGVYQYSFDGGYTWQTPNTNTYSSNTTITAGTIKVKDNAGNITSYNTGISITKIDKTSPTISDVTGNPVNWTNDDATLTVHATDGAFGVYQYSFDGGYTWQTPSTNNYSSNTTIPGGTIKVKDNAGNVTSYSTDISIAKIDKAAPANPNITINSSPVKQIHPVGSFIGLFFSSPVSVGLSSTDNLSGVKQYEYQLVSDGGKLNPADTAWIT